jgi:putative membrane-bound dehydrogenase-like protein
MKNQFIFCVAILILTFSTYAQKGINNNQVSPAEHLELLPEIAQQNKLTLWADSKLIKSPIAIDIDTQGRVWATEDIGGASDIVILSDTDGDGKADKRQVFVQEPFLKTAMSLAVFDNQIVVGNAPHIIIYTDINRNGKFEKGIDKREIFLTGFDGRNHDHGLHSLVGGPNGQWYFNHGNKGMTVTTKDGKLITAASYYGNQRNIGKKSFDGRTYIGGLTLRINPDGSGATVINQNNRNSDLAISSFGDIFQVDNDDPAHSRASWAIEYGNYGYADLNNGGKRSWKELSKSWDFSDPKKEMKHIEKKYLKKHRIIEHSYGHWKENYPGTAPIGTLLGAGAPIGQLFVEGDELGKELRGAFISTECVRRALLILKPKLHDAQYEMGPFESFLKTQKKYDHEPFFPVDIAAGTDGSLFVADWVSHRFNRGAGVLNEGAIYRVSRKNEKKVSLPLLDFKTNKGLLIALKNAAINVRWLAVNNLISKGPSVTSDLIHFYNTETNPYYRARAVWVLAQLGKKGKDFVESLFKDKNPEFRLLAFRALRYATPKNIISYAQKLNSDKNPSVRREVLLGLRDLPVDDVMDIFPALIKTYDGKNRYYLEALGAAVDGKDDIIYKKIVKTIIGKNDYSEWNQKDRNLAWRFYQSDEALKDLLAVMKVQEIQLNEFRRLLHAFAIYPNEKIRERNKAYLVNLQKVVAGKDYKDSIAEVIFKDLTILGTSSLNVNRRVPSFTSNGITIKDEKVISQLKGNAVNGKVKSQICLMCHQISKAGVDFGPNLTHWGQERTIQAIIKEIAKPSDHLAHGFDKNVRITSKDKKSVIEGIELGYYYHAGEIRIKTFGGQYMKFATRAQKYVKESWMPTPDKLGLNNQDVRDIAEYLKTLGVEHKEDSHNNEWSPLFKPSSLDGWKSNFDGKAGYDIKKHWTIKDGTLHTTGKPTSVLYSKKSYKNFELKFEWKHHNYAGNSGLFIWIKKVGGRLAEGIEVQILDPGYESSYKKNHTDRNRPRWKGEVKWFTGHGDVFPVGKVKMTPFLPSAPEPREKFRSFPTENRTKNHGQWNQYHIKAINGVIRLSVNGKEVSGGYNISPDFGPLAFESEGKPITFRKIMIKELPDNAKDSGLLKK